MTLSQPKPQVILVECADQPGLVHGVTGALLDQGANVVVNQEFVDRVSQRFFMRTEFDGNIDEIAILSRLRIILPEDAIVSVSRLEPKRVVVFVTKEHHCLGEILIRNSFGDINARVLAVVANQPDLGAFVDKFGIPFHHLPVVEGRREVQEDAVLSVLEKYQPEFLVLAKYMRVLSPAFVSRFRSRILNIHHSFLPAFAGGRPYQQAFDRGVKVIGATAHFVTSELDAGPIIVQQVMPVDHTHAAADLQRSGRDVEQMVLARALSLVFEDRVFLCGNRTVIFD